ncbi:hypothetical protein HF086_007667 [Spodoptera exigua]|uniref:PiggyBac transposable element-derived protein domain-containing protein n=1 Tax=Spodoptera exigua TaxID=7107 RepID=A0A922M6H9_SPOEX|nr:hypothetical protein HF086_007667 [Spodoptera exigua]
MARSPPSPQPGPSNWDVLSAELSGMMSPQNIVLEDNMSGFNFEMSDADLYGILTDNMDNIIDEWANENPETETGDYEEELPTQTHEDTPETPSTWYPGNPTSMIKIPFTGTPGLLPPHNMYDKNYPECFFLFFYAHLCDLIVECTNKRGNKLKTEVNTPRGRFTKWKDVTIPELKVFIGVLLFMGTVKLNRMADYWSTNYLMQLSPHLFMSRDRFYFILRALNVQTDERPESIFKIKPLIDLFNQSMCSIYYPAKKHHD